MTKCEMCDYPATHYDVEDYFAVCYDHFVSVVKGTI